MENVLESLRFLSSSKVTERKKGVDQLLKVSLLNNDVISELSALSKRSSLKRGISVVTYSVSWEIVFDCARTCLSLELEKLESSGVGNSSSFSQNSSVLSTSKSSPVVASGARIKSLSDAVALIKLILDLGCQTSSRFSYISAENVIEHICRVMQDEGARFLIGKEYLQMMQKYILSNEYFANYVSIEQWNDLALVFLSESKSPAGMPDQISPCGISSLLRGNSNVALYLSVCRSVLHNVIKYNSIMLDHDLIQKFFKRHMDNVASIERNGSYLFPIVSQYSEFVQYSVGSLSISEKLLFHILPPLFTSLSKNCVVSISSKDSLLTFFSATAEILADYVAITKCNPNTCICDDSDERSYNLAVYNMNNLYECIVNAIELDLQQCDPKIGITRKVKVSEKCQFFQLVQTVTTRMFQSIYCFGRELSSYRSMLNGSIDEPSRKRQKLELKLEGWSDFFNLLNNCSGQLGQLYVAEMLVTILETSREVTFGLNNLTQLLENCYSIVTSTENGPVLKVKALQLCCRSFQRITSVHDKYATRTVAKKCLDFSVKQLGSPNSNMESVCFEVILVICEVYEQTDEIQPIIFDYLLTTINVTHMSADITQLDENCRKVGSLKLLFWALDKNFLSWLRNYSRMKNNCSLTEVNERMRQLCLKFIDLVISATGDGTFDCNLNLSVVKDHSRLMHAVLMELCKVGAVDGEINLCLWKHLCSSMKQMLEHENIGKLASSNVVFVMSLCARTLSSPNAALSGPKKDLYSVIEDCFNLVMKEVDQILNIELSSQSFNILGNTLQRAFMGICLLSSDHVKLEDIARQQQMDLLKKVSLVLERLLKLGDSGPFGVRSHEILESEVTNNCEEQKNGANYISSTLELIVIATQILIMLAHDRSRDPDIFDLVTDQVLNVKSSLLKENGFVLVFQKLLSEKILVQSLNQHWVAHILTMLTEACKKLRTSDVNSCEQVLDHICILADLTFTFSVNFDPCVSVVIYDLTLPTFWSMMSADNISLKFRERVIRCITSFVCSGAVLDSYGCFNPCSGASQTNQADQSENRSFPSTKITQLIVKEFLKGHKNLSHQCAEGLVKYSNKCVHKMSYVLDELQLQTELFWNNLQGNDDRFSVVKTNLVAILSRVNIVSSGVEEKLFKFMACYFHKDVLSLHEVAEILHSHSVIAEIFGETFYKAIVKQLVINFDLKSVISLGQLFGKNISDISDLLVCSPLQCFTKLHQNGNNAWLSDSGILTGLSSVNFPDLSSSDQRTIFAGWFSTCIFQGSANPSMDAFNKFFNLAIDFSQFNVLISKSTAQILSNILCLNSNQDKQLVNERVNNCLSFLLKLANVGRFEYYLYPIQVQLLHSLQGSFLYAQGRVFEVVEALKVQATFAGYLTSENISTNCSFYLETFFATLLPLKNFPLDSQPLENISSICRSICLMTSYAIKCKWMPIRFYLPVLVELILGQCSFVSKETLFKDDMLDAWCNFMRAISLSEENVIELFDQKLLDEMCKITSESENEEPLPLEQLLTVQSFNNDNEACIREMLKKINQYLKICPKNIHCFGNMFRVAVASIFSMPSQLLLQQCSFTETCDLILSHIQNEENEYCADRKILGVIESTTQMKVMELLLQQQTKDGCRQPTGNDYGFDDSSCMSSQTVLAKIYSLLIGDTASFHDTHLTHLALSATHQLAKKFPNETKNLLSVAKNEYLNRKIEECCKNDYLSSIVCKDEDFLDSKMTQMTVLTDVQYLLLSLFSGTLQISELNNTFCCLEHIVLYCPLKASQLLPVLCALASKETQEKISKSFERKFLEFCNEGASQESVMPYFNCMLELMKFHQGQMPNVSHLNWLSIDFSLLSRVAYNLKHYSLAIMFCEISIMAETNFDMNYSSTVPIDECSSSDLQQIAIKSSLARARKACKDSAIGYGIERSSSEELEILSYTNCCEEGDNSVATILSSVKKLASLKTQGQKHSGLISKLLNESSISDFADLFSLPRRNVKIEDWRHLSDKFESSLVSEEYAKQLSNWNQLDFLDKTSCFDVFFISELGNIKEKGALKLNLCSKLLMREIQTENFTRESVSCAVFKFTSCKYLIEDFHTNLIQNKLPRIQWDEDVSPKRLDNLFMFQKVVIDTKSKRLEDDGVSAFTFLALQDEIGREYVDYLIGKKRFHAAETLLNFLTKNVSQSCYEPMFCKLLWNKGSKSQSISRLTKLVQESSNHATKSDNIKAQAQLQLAKFHTEACSETPTRILQLLEGALHSANSDISVTQQCLLSLAKFADDQYVKIDQFLRSEENQRVKNRIKLTERELECMLTQAASNCRYYREIQARQWRDVKEQEMHVSQRSQFLEKALQSYLTWLKSAQSTCDGNGGQDLALFRLISLWFANDTDKNIASFLAVRIFDISVDHFIHVIPQLVGRLPSAEQSLPQSLALFDEILRKLLINIGNKHFFHAIYNLLAVINAQAENKYSKKLRQASLDKKRIDAAWIVLNNLDNKHSEMKSVKALVDAYLETAYADRGKYKNQYVMADFTRSTKLIQIKNLISIPVPTTELQVEPNGDYSKVPFIVSFDKRFSVCGGLNAPRVVKVNCSDGSILKQLVKGNDDLRQDAVMQQVFGLCNRLLNQDNAARKRELCMKTYKVVALAPNCGVLEWCEGTIPLGDYLCGSKGGGKQDIGAHQRYRPGDWLNKDCHNEMAKCRETNQGSEDALLKAFKKVCRNFQPVLHFFFLETFKDAEVWFEKRVCFTRSVATSSMIGYIVGLGDRHTSNILLSTTSAEIVHIDLGMAFEQGKELSVPETVPFRLTRDLVSAFGVSSVEGVFRKACELTMSVLRHNHDVITTIAQVLVHDPLYNWTLSPVKALMMEGEDLEENNNAAFLSVGGNNLDQSDSRKNQSAVRVLERICAKLRGMDGSGDSGAAVLSVEGQVNCLIKEATDFKNLSKLFYGWRPWA